MSSPRPSRVQPYQNTRHGRRTKIDHGSRQTGRQPPDIPAHGSKGQAIWVRVAYGRVTRGERREKELISMWVLPYGKEARTERGKYRYRV